MCSNIGTSKTVNFPFGTNGKLMVLGVPILKHFRVDPFYLDFGIKGKGCLTTEFHMTGLDIWRYSRQGKLLFDS